jgi:hypothetical protein
MRGPLGELFGGVLELCERAGLVSSGVVAIDGTKMPAQREPQRECRLWADRAGDPR